MVYWIRSDPLIHQILYIQKLLATLRPATSGKKSNLQVFTLQLRPRRRKTKKPEIKKGNRLQKLRDKLQHNKLAFSNYISGVSVTTILQNTTTHVLAKRKW